jgi:hypothetical protein
MTSGVAPRGGVERGSDVKRMLVFVLVPLVLAVTVGVSFAAGGPGHTSSGDVGTTRVIQFLRRGPSAFCDRDVCGIGGVVAKPFRFVGSQQRYQATIELSFDYTTSARGAFGIQVDVSGPGGRLQVEPRTRPLTAEGATDSTTAVFLVPNLRPGVTYELSLSGALRKGPHRNVSIKTANMVVTVEASES